MTAGYSGKPLAEKLGLKEGDRVLLVDAPKDDEALLERAPSGLTFLRRRGKGVNVAHVFVASRADLEARFAGLLEKIVEGGMLSISWPKKGAGVPTDVTEDDLRAIVLPMGWVDVMVCAIDATWSGLKFLRRRR